MSLGFFPALSLQEALPPQRPFMMLGLLWLFSAGWACPGHATSLYRCQGSEREIIFTSHPMQGLPCTLISHDSTPPVVAKPATAASRQWSYREMPQATAASAGTVSGQGKILRGAVYRVVRRDGSVEYTNIAPDKGVRAVTTLFTYIATCLACDLHSKIDWESVALHLDAFGATIRAASLDSGVNEALLRAVIHAESAFNPLALSYKGAQGLMQLMPPTANHLGVLDAFDPAQNIRGGARFLAELLRTFHGDERLAVAAYNAGPGAVQKYGGVPPYAETRVYVNRVAVLRRRYATARMPLLLAE